MNVIKQIVGDGKYGSQTIKMIVKDNERGPQGEKGEPGVNATITAGEAYSTPAGSSPVVINTGTDTNAVFDFYIPKGDKGDKGEPGEDGRDGSNGINGRDGVIQYKAGKGIKIVNDVISATGGGGGGGGGDGVWGEITGDINDQTDLQEEFANYTPTADLATVATSGSYSDLSNKPTIPAAQIQSDWNQSNSSKVDYIKNKPTIPAAQVNSDWNAVSGVAQILNKPTIPTVNNATLTIQQNGANVATFTANSSTNATANITSPNITMTTTDPGEGSALSANNFVAVYGADLVNMDYSVNEINTGTKWIDGSAIYKKTIDVGTFPNNSEKTVAHGISNLNIVVKFDATAKAANTGNNVPVPFVSTTLANQVYLTVSPTNITIGCGTDRTGLYGYVTLYYTKTS